MDTTQSKVGLKTKSIQKMQNLTNMLIKPAEGHAKS